MINGNKHYIFVAAISIITNRLYNNDASSTRATETKRVDNRDSGRVKNREYEEIP